MKAIRKMGAQGDVLFRRIGAPPEDAQEQAHRGPLVVAHSETGHHHVIECAHARLLTGADPFISYLRLDGSFADVAHRRPYDTHETLRLLGDESGPSYFEIRRQREHVPAPQPTQDDEVMMISD